MTVGLAGHYAVKDGPVVAAEALPGVDVQSLHWYFGEERLSAGLARARSAMEKPLVLQEFGVSGLLWDEASAEGQYQRACRAAEAAQLAGFGAWELYDHPVGSIRWVKEPWKESQENYFGLLRPDGTPKRQAAAFCRCLDAPALRIVRPRPDVGASP